MYLWLLGNRRWGTSGEGNDVVCLHIGDKMQCAPGGFVDIVKEKCFLMCKQTKKMGMEGLL